MIQQLERERIHNVRFISFCFYMRAINIFEEWEKFIKYGHRGGEDEKEEKKIPMIVNKL